MFCAKKKHRFQNARNKQNVIKKFLRFYVFHRNYESAKVFPTL